MQSRKQLYIAGIIGILVLIGVAGIFAWQTTNQNSQVEYEPLPDAEPAADQTQYLNISALVDKGLTAEHVESFKAAVKKYKPAAKQAVVFSNSVNTAHDRNSPVFNVHFTMSIDNVIFQARIEYTNLSAIRLFLTDRNGAQVFDSQVIDA